MTIEAWVELDPRYCTERFPELMAMPGLWVLLDQPKEGHFRRVKVELDMLRGLLRWTCEDGSTQLEQFWPDMSEKVQ